MASLYRVCNLYPGRRFVHVSVDLQDEDFVNVFAQQIERICVHMCRHDKRTQIFISFDPAVCVYRERVEGNEPLPRSQTSPCHIDEYAAQRTMSLTNNCCLSKGGMLVRVLRRWWWGDRVVSEQGVVTLLLWPNLERATTPGRDPHSPRHVGAVFSSDSRLAEQLSPMQVYEGIVVRVSR